MIVALCVTLGVLLLSVLALLLWRIRRARKHLGGIDVLARQFNENERPASTNELQMFRKENPHSHSLTQSTASPTHGRPGNVHSNSSSGDWVPSISTIPWFSRKAAKAGVPDIPLAQTLGSSHTAVPEGFIFQHQDANSGQLHSIVRELPPPYAPPAP